MTNSFEPFRLRYRTRVRRTPASPTIERPGSIINVKSPPAARRHTCSMKAEGDGGNWPGRYEMPRPPPRSRVWIGMPVPRRRSISKHPFHGFENGRCVQQLRADVAARALHQQIRQVARLGIYRFDFGDVDAEFVFAQSGGDIRVRLRVHVGIHAKRDARLNAAPHRDFTDEAQFRQRLRVEGMNAPIERVADLLGGLSGAAENNR